MTRSQALEQARQQLQESLELAREEAHARARLLLDFATQTRFAHLHGPLQVLAPAEQQLFDTSLQRATQGEPLPYIIGRQEFYGRDFRVAAGVLIPRPETELLVEATLSRLQKIDAPQLVDMGTGSGCIAVSLALEKPRSRVLATDASTDALEIARENARIHHAKSQIEFALSTPDWLGPLQGREAAFDAIVSNPPYIARAEIEELQPEVRLFEPRGALDGGDDGLDVYRHFARTLRPFLLPRGFVALELGAGQFKAVRGFFHEENWRVEEAILDFVGIERVLIART